jgi:phenylalanyl-tRNA synthetase beta chain
MHVRYAQAGEQLLLLNEQTVTPSADTALIADDEKPLAMAGVMGGEHSGISDTTRDLFLESAFFPPAAIAGKARALGFSSDASHRYERGVDFDLQRRAIERATQLILETCGGQARSGSRGGCRRAFADAQAGAIAAQRTGGPCAGIPCLPNASSAMLKSLGLAVERVADGLRVTPPSFRFDIEIEEDLIEEIARLHGYDNIPSTPPVARLAMMPASESRKSAMALRRQMAARDYHEVVTYSFVEAAWETDFAANAGRWCWPIRSPARWA